MNSSPLLLCIIQLDYCLRISIEVIVGFVYFFLHLYFRCILIYLLYIQTTGIFHTIPYSYNDRFNKIIRREYMQSKHTYRNEKYHTFHTTQFSLSLVELNNFIYNFIIVNENSLCFVVPSYNNTFTLFFFNQKN